MRVSAPERELNKDAQRIELWPRVVAVLRGIIGQDNPAVGQPGHLDYGVAIVKARDLLIEIKKENL